LKTPLDDVKDTAKRVIAEGVASGKKFEEIAQELSEMLGKKITPSMVRYFYYREFGDVVSDTPRSSTDVVDDEGEFDLEKELIWLYRVQKKRIRRLVRLEEEAGLPLPDTSKNIDIASRILEKLGKIGSAEDENIIEKVLEALESDTGTEQ